jgi:hypothetical protein
VRTAPQRVTRRGSRTGTSGLGNEATGAAHAGRLLLAPPCAGGQMWIRTDGTAGDAPGKDLAAARPFNGVAERCCGNLLGAAITTVTTVTTAVATVTAATMVAAAMITTVAARAEQTTAARHDHGAVRRAAATI